MGISEVEHVSFLGAYEVYSDGRIYSHKRNRFLQPWENKGYMMITLKGKQYTLARVVIEAFSGIVPNRVQFRDMDSKNCRLDNLIWR